MYLYVYLQTLLSHLVENNRHDEEVQQEALRGMRTVEVEKDEGEEQGEELETGVAEGCTQEFQACDCRQENITAGDGTKKSSDNRYNRWFITNTHTHTLVFVAICVHSLDSQLLAVTEGEAIIGQRAQHDGGVHHVLLKAQEAHVQSLKPHQHGILCNTNKNNEITQADQNHNFLE